MRWKEIRDGVTIFRFKSNGEKENLGDSPVAGRRAVGMTAASRVLTNSECQILRLPFPSSQHLLPPPLSPFWPCHSFRPLILPPSSLISPVPTLILPPLVLAYLQRKKVVPSAGPWARIADLSLIGTSLLIFLPPAIATFPQTASIETGKLESKFQGLKDENGREVEAVRFNKGL